MKTKLILTTAAAASALLSGSAMADSNQTKLIQSGAGNVGSVVQNGTNNFAGMQTYSPTYTLQQLGDNNVLDVLQTGKRNELGMDNGNRYASTGWVNYSPSGFSFPFVFKGVTQKNDRNKITVNQNNLSQTYAGNAIGAIKQTGVVGATELTNVLSITQSETASTLTNGPHHYVGVVTQTFTGAGNVLNTQNDITIEQLDGGYNKGNAIYAATQNGQQNGITLHQSGTRNEVGAITQTATGNKAILDEHGDHNLVLTVTQNSTSGLSGNSATISLTGNENGRLGFTGGRAAALAGAPSSSVNQVGGGNIVSYTVYSGGSYNQFGFYQNGNGNLAQSIQVTGNYNELGVSQSGDDNKLLLASIGGDDNNIGLTQNGTSNLASLTIDGTGNRNGGYHNFTVGGEAASAGLTAGLLIQTGLNNSVSLHVTGSDNIFATSQNTGTYTGSQVNTIVGIISGDNNEAAVIQAGHNDTANFVQTGSMNNAYISQ